MKKTTQLITAKKVLEAFSQFKNEEKGALLQRFFKTGPGQYAHGDIFWGLTVP